MKRGLLTIIVATVIMSLAITMMFAGCKPETIEDVVTEEEMASTEEAASVEEATQTTGERTTFQHNWDDLRDYPTPADYESATGKKITSYQQSPILDALVASGELPEVEDRLPKEPYVIEPFEEIGQYGGTIYESRMGTGHWSDAIMAGMPVESMFRFGSDYKTVLPNVARGWEYSDDCMTLTIYLREGMKWSDGVPFTADDIIFAYEDIFLNEELFPTFPTEWTIGGEPTKFVKVDDYTFQMIFPEPFPTAHILLAHANTGTHMIRCKHYLKNYLPEYAGRENLEEMASDAGFESWVDLYQSKRETWSNHQLQNTERPVLHPFTLTQITPSGSILERNPYYWKVDVEGNQLPYVDKIEVAQVESWDIILSKAAAGEQTLSGFATEFSSYTLYKENEDKADYRTLIYNMDYGSMCAFMPNQTIEDPVLRQLFRDVRFRRALSLAIDRDEINKIVYMGFAVPRQNTLIDSSLYVKPEFTKAYAELDLDTANSLLDDMGLKWDQNHEYRLGPDGNKLSWVVELVEGNNSTMQICELTQGYWKKIGVDISIKSDRYEVVAPRSTDNKIAMFASEVFGATDNIFISEPQFFVLKLKNWAAPIAPLWSEWIGSNGLEGEEPPEIIKNLKEWHDIMLTTSDENERIRMGQNILQAQAENLWTIGTVGMAPQVVLVKKNFRNIPEEGIWGWGHMWTWTQHQETFFFKQD